MAETKSKYQEWFDSLEDQTSTRADTYREAAKRIHQTDGEVEIDDNAVVSYSDDGGAYVAAWVWVDKADAGEGVENG